MSRHQLLGSQHSLLCKTPTGVVATAQSWATATFPESRSRIGTEPKNFFKFFVKECFLWTVVLVSIRNRSVPSDMFTLQFG